MLRIYYSNRLERLLDQLAAIVAEPLADPLVPEQVVTQSQGMARWLALNLAERNGIVANVEFVLPATFVWRSFVQHIPGLTDASAFDRRVLAWRLMAILPAWLDKPAFASLARYLNGARPELRRWQLCRQIADVFDQYLIYRPEMVLQWEKGEGDEWQAHLWRSLARGAGSPHRAALWEEFLRRCDQKRLDRASLPARLMVFGIPTLPPAYMDLLRRLAEEIEIHLLVLNPCLLYWGDIEDPRNIARLRRARGPIHPNDYYEIGNPLLASLGRQGRDFIDLLHDFPVEDVELFDAPDERTLLGCIQADILTLADRSRGEMARPEIDEGDASLQVHSCHSPMREVEVLHDRLLALFSETPSLRPQDVVVMAPNIEEYAPFIEAVFGSRHDGRRIPFSVADLSREHEHPLVQAFMQIIDVATGRFTASEVLSLLEVPAVLRRFGLTLEEFEGIRIWVAESGIRWGLNGQSRVAWDLPQEEANSWEFGFRRLFLGYALPPREEALFAGVLPYPHVEGHDAAALGRLRHFIERVAGYGARLRGHYTAVQWAALLHELIEAFFEPENDEAEPLQILRDAAATLVDEAARGTYDAPFGLDLLRDYLRGQWAESGGAQHFLTGRVTFCAMIPMRSVPFRVVCLLGMGDQNFPRIRRPVGFDKMAEHPRRGDRSRRDDDRYLFLEALLSARDLFYVSYVGRNIRDNSLKLPSVLVTELLDYATAASAGDPKITRRRLITEHPLQPFSARYFEGGNSTLFSYAEEWLAGVQARSDGMRQALPRFFSTSLSEVTVETIELANLVQFFRHPARALLRERLGVQFEVGEELIEDTEPFALDYRSAWSLKEELLRAALQGEPPQERQAIARARGILPGGTFGRLCFEAQRESAEAVAEQVRPLLAPALPPLEVKLTVGDQKLLGWLHHRTPAGLLRYRAAKRSARELLDLWIHHLALNALAPADGAAYSRFVDEEGLCLFRPVPDAAARLAELIALYREGLCSPLHFMPASALEYAKSCDADCDAALRKARHRWEGSDYHRGEGDDLYCHLAFRGDDPIDTRFGQTARVVFQPLLDAMESH